jgi:hypothetical protein
MNNIVAPCEHDALSGRGGHTIHWSGNIKFRALVEQHRSRYHSASRVEKGKVVSEVVQIWRQMTPPGRFLALSDPKAGDASPWHDIGDKAAQKKTAKRLREGLTTTMSGTTATVSSDSSISSESSIISNSSGSNNCNISNNMNIAPIRSAVNIKRSLRRVSNDGMEKSAKRARMEMNFIGSFDEQIPKLNLPSFAEDDFEPVNDNDDEFLGLSAEEFDLDNLFEEQQGSTLFKKTNDYSMDNFHESLISLTFPMPTKAASTVFSNAAGYFESPMLQDIAVSIPSAAALTESSLFD